MDERSNPDLESALARGDLSPRKVAFAKEVLRRRYVRRLRSHLWGGYTEPGHPNTNR